VRDPLVELIDLGPTFLELAGLGELERASGVSLGPLLRGGAEVLRETVFSEYGPRVMARTEDWKLVFYPGEEYGELYQLDRDPEELYNLYAMEEYAGVRGEMVERMMDWYGTTQGRR